MPRQLPRRDEALSEPLRPRRPVWDLPTRLVHWLLAGLIGFSWWSVKNHHPDWHIWSGIAVLTLLLFRLMWGVVGSSTARFASFVGGPRTLREYFAGKWRGIGHSPLGGWSVVALYAAVAVQVGLGLFSQDEDGIYAGPLARLLSSDRSDNARGLHELFFNVLLALIALHVAAILFYRIVRGKKLVGAMISGRAEIDPDAAPMRAGKWWAALICIVLALAVTRWVIAGAPPFGT